MARFNPHRAKGKQPMDTGARPFARVHGRTPHTRAAPAPGAMDIGPDTPTIQESAIDAHTALQVKKKCRRPPRWQIFFPAPRLRPFCLPYAWEAAGCRTRLNQRMQPAAPIFFADASRCAAQLFARASKKRKCKHAGAGPRLTCRLRVMVARGRNT